MDQSERISLIASLVDQLDRRGWCSETKVQKAAFFVETMFGIPLGFDWTLYRHGPFTSELRGDLAVLEQAGAVVREVAEEGYPRLRYRRRADQYTSDPATAAIEVVATALAPMKIAEMERAATALWLTGPGDGGSIDDHVERLCFLKPHVERAQARDALVWVSEFRRRGYGPGSPRPDLLTRLRVLNQLGADELYP